MVYEEFTPPSLALQYYFGIYLLVIVGLRDHMVTPGSALDFAKRLRAPTLEIDSDCGHLSFACEKEQFRGAVREFLDQ